MTSTTVDTAGTDMAGTEALDVVVVGAGLSGIAAGYHLQTERPGDRFAILEARGALGGTWDLFKYPGLRSDSDMPTYGFEFQPWRGALSIADGASILDYLQTTVREHGIDRHIRFHRRVARASWSSTEALWTLTVEDTEAQTEETVTCRFLMMCSGYYDYAHPHAPTFEGTDRFSGPIVHPQFWPDNLDWAGKRVVVVGSGATAVTLAPVLARTAAHVTMLQRSPTYIVSQPALDASADWLRGHLPETLAYRLTRGKNAASRLLFYAFARRYPARAKRFLIRQVQNALGPDYDVATHFTPSYDPYDERICIVPDADLFDAIRDGRVEVVTDRVETLTETGIRLRSGAHIDADILITATGLSVVLMGHARLDVDGEPVDLASCVAYRGVLLSGVPNFASVFGYTNTSWTLRADLSCEYVCRLLRYMEKKGYASVVPERDPAVREAPFLDFNSGYVARARAGLPRQGTTGPWRNTTNFLWDAVAMRHVPFKDRALAFTRRDGTTAPRRARRR